MLTRTLVIGLIVLLFAAPIASAQQQITETSISVDVSQGQSDPSQGLERGTGTSAFIYIRYCFDGPGLNPDQNKVQATVEVTVPEWVNMAPIGDVLEWTPPQVQPLPTGDDGCSQKQFELKYGPKLDAPYGAEGTLDYVVTIAETGDMGTYQSVATTESGSMPVTVETEPVDPVTGKPIGEDDDGTGNGGSGPVDTAPEESPAPAPLFVLISLVVFAALRRRS